MALTITKSEGVTVLSIPSKTDSNVPLVIQLLAALCCSPVCYVSQRLRKLLAGTQTTLGTLQIMVGLFNIGLGAIVAITTDRYLLWIGAPFWLGGVFIAAGLMSILGERFPSPCLVFLTALMNLASACLAVTAIVLYTIDLVQGNSLGWRCKSYEDSAPYQPRRRYYWGTTLPPEDFSRQQHIRRTNYEMCHSMRNILLVLLTGMRTLLILFAVLQLCVTISATVLGIKALCKNRTKEEPKPDPELYKPLVDEVTTSATV